MRTSSYTRRQFLGQATGLALTAAAFPTLVPATALGRAGRLGANDRIAVAAVGVGPQGTGDMKNFLAQKDAQVVVVCDVKTDQLEQARQLVNKQYGNQDCAVTGDFQEVMARKDIDACLIATPDHWHVLTALAAVRSGKDVYLEKPMGLSLTEDWTLRKEVHRCKRIFQFGTQQRSGRFFRYACELVRNGRIGKLKHINVWAPGSAPGGPTNVAPVPPGLNYDLWLGPAPFKPHTQDLCAANGKTWWFISSYALGFIAGWGIHPLDIALWGGGDLLNGPVEIQGRGTFHMEGACDTATVWDIDMTFASGVTLKFVGVPNGGNASRPTCDPWTQEGEWRQRYQRITGHGTAFEGTDGWVHVDREGIHLQPENLIDQKEEDLPIHLKKSSNHARDFLDCVRSRAETVCPIDEAVRGDALCHLSDIAIRLNRKVTWDLSREHFIDDEEANLRLRARKMRPPWHL